MPPVTDTSGETLAPGIAVTARCRSWIVQSVARFEDCVDVRLSGSDSERPCRLALLSPFDRIAPVTRTAQVEALAPRAWLHAVCRLAARAHPLGGLRAAARSRLELLPYQLEPALAIARGESRLLVADEVGLGKTVQAALILSELRAADSHSRALIVAPAGLRAQWARELAARFDISATTADAAWLRASGRDLPADVNPWVLPGVYLTSFDFLKRPEVLRAVEDLTWDVLVVDEAHNAGEASARGAAVHAVASRARRVILLTATPHSGDSKAFEALCAIGAHGPLSEPIVIFRRTRSDAGIRGERRTVLLGVRLSAAERRMHRQLERYTRQVWREAGSRGDASARLAAVVLRKRALSSAASLAASLERRRRLLAGEVSPSERQLRLPLDDEALPDREPDAILGAPGLADVGRERDLLARLATSASRAAARESKLRALSRFLRRAGEPAIVFTEYRDTLARIHQALEAGGFQCVVLHGAQTAAERDAAQQAFNHDGSVLLATDAASEGLNLHARCRLVIHFELPWSPARLEQRTGRVDRIGQTRRVHQVLFVARHTAERLVLAPLVRKAAAARAAGTAGSGLVEALREATVAEAVMNGDVPEVAVPVAQRRPRAESDRIRREAEAECDRLQSVRRWLATSDDGRRHRDQVPASCHAPTRRPRQLVCVYSVSLLTSAGRLVHRALIVVRDAGAAAAAGSPLDGRCRRRPSRRDIRDAVRRWLDVREPIVRAAIGTRIEPDLAGIERACGAAIEGMARRDAALARCIGSTARRLVQAGLFENRAVNAARARRRVAAGLLEDLGDRCAAAAKEVTLTRRLEPVAFLWTDAQP